LEDEKVIKKEDERGGEMSDIENPDKIERFGEHKYNKLKIFLDFLLLIAAFAVAYFIKRGHFNFEDIYVKFLPLYFACWVLSSIFTDKLKNHESEKGYMKRLEPFFSSAFFFIGMLSLLIYGLNLYQLSRFIVFGSLGIYLLLEVLVLSGNFLSLSRSEPGSQTAKKRSSVTFFLLEFFLITVSFFAIHFLKIGTIELQENYEEILLLIYFLWIFTGLLVHKFQVPTEKNFIKMIYPFLKSDFIVASIASLFVFGFRTGFSRLLVFGSMGIYACFEILVISIYYLYRLQEKLDVPETRFFDVPEVSLYGDRMVKEVVEKEREKTGKIEVSPKKFSASLVREKLQNTYLTRFPGVFIFVDRVVDLDTVDIRNAEVMDTGNPYNVEILPDHSLEFFMNLHTLNDFRRVNQYLIEVNRKIKNQGIFLGKFEPCEKRHIYFLKNYPRFLANVLYFFDFTWRRVFPKLPLLKKIYFVVTKESSRVFSMAEALGRIYFCGFEIVSLESVDNLVYFIAQKVKESEDNPNPSYGLLFKQRRIGKNRKIIYIYKMRTMHPYSEYIHQYVYERNRLDEKGKIKDDFRITAWGKVFRKLFIDEIPMLINWIKGDLKLVGVRPLSETIFNAYPEDLQNERIQYKPGLVPPYYVDMPNNMEEVWESEKNYLEKYKKHPKKTDMAYFFKAVKNILFHHARSE
jgi:lipopolysaccharide/colanic/teichoic acid biosynthesis glycosyltransferase